MQGLCSINPLMYPLPPQALLPKTVPYLVYTTPWVLIASSLPQMLTKNWVLMLRNWELNDQKSKIYFCSCYQQINLCLTYLYGSFPLPLSPVQSKSEYFFTKLSLNFVSICCIYSQHHGFQASIRHLLEKNKNFLVSLWDSLQYVCQHLSNNLHLSTVSKIPTYDSYIP